jgi:hypothetical protein
MPMSYMLYQAERVKTRTEQRAEDVQIGQLAAALGRSWRSPGRRSGLGRRRFRGAVEAARPAPCVPAPRPALDDHQCRV